MPEPLPPSDARVVPLAFMAVSRVGFALRRAINLAIEEGRISKPSKRVDRDLADRVLGLNTKVACLPVIVARLIKNWHEVRQHALARDRSLDGYVLDGKRKESREMVVDTESLFTTLKSAYDVGQRLAKCVARRILGLNNASVTTMLAGVSGLSETERELLEHVRGEFVHASAPWFEVIIPENGNPDLAILLSHEPDYGAGEGYILLSTAGILVDAVVAYIDALEAQLVAAVDAHRRSAGQHNANTK